MYNVEMGGLCKERSEADRRLEEEDRRQRWVEFLQGATANGAVDHKPKENRLCMQGGAQ